MNGMNGSNSAEFIFQFNGRRGQIISAQIVFLSPSNGIHLSLLAPTINYRRRRENGRKIGGITGGERENSQKTRDGEGGGGKKVALIPKAEEEEG